MQIYILRHGIAEESSRSGRDADRELTAEGGKRVREVLRVARKAGVSPDVIITSPYVRAVQTAEIAAKELAYEDELVHAQALIPSSSPVSVWDEVRAHQVAPQVMLVGHEPLLSQAAVFLLNASAMQIDVKKGSVIRIDVDSFGPQPRGVLKWMLVPKLAV
jgi:phosphohistidine phosphatase